MNLKEIGLSEYEEKAYRTLILHGKQGAGTISKESGVSYGKIYEVLGSLERKGLVRVVPEKTKKFIATEPEHLMQLVNKKEEELLEIKKEIVNFKKIYINQEKENVQLVKGKNNFYKLMRQVKFPEKTSYNIKYSSEYHPEFVRDVKKAISKGVDQRALVRQDNETISGINQWKKIYKEIKPIENEGVSISIVDDDQIMIALIKSNTTLLIQDIPFVKLMKQLFLKYYENTK